MIYIGQTSRKSTEDRRKEHLSYKAIDGTNKLYTEMRKGHKDFKFEVLLRKEYPSFEALDTMESVFIETYNTIKDGLNMLMPKRVF